MRTAAVLAATLLLAGCTDGYRRAAPSPSPSAGIVPSATATHRVLPTPTWSPPFPGALFCVTRPPVYGGGEICEPDTDPPPRPDVDGDRLPDEVTTVEAGDQSDDTWRWGLRVAMTSLGTQTVWNQCCPDGQQFYVLGDVDGDGDVELAGVYGTTGTSSSHFLVTVSRGRLTIVDSPELCRGWCDGMRSWGCAPGGVVVARAEFFPEGARIGTSGTRTYYRLVGTRLVRTRVVRDDWSGGRPRPAEYDGGLITCG